MTRLHFAQISDVHISTRGDYLDMLSGRTATFLADALARLSEVEDLDFLLLSGDLFDAADLQELRCFQEVISAWHKPYYIIPGNHDRRDAGAAGGLSRQQFYRLFNPQFGTRPGRPEAQAGYWSLTVHPTVQLIGLDSTRDQDWGGTVDALQQAWLEEELVAHADKLVILAVHHPLHALAPIDEHPDWTNFVCDNGPQVLALLDDHPQVKLVLTAHHHLTQAEARGGRLHLACPALATYPCAYRSLCLTQAAGDAWQVEWRTHPAADEATIAEARERMIQAWIGEGFEAASVEAYARLALGHLRDREGRAIL